MSKEALAQEIELELTKLNKVVSELSSLQADLSSRAPTVREITAAAAFLAQFYNGVENILKRISVHHEVALPQGNAWHIDLFTRFCRPSYDSLPVLFEENLQKLIAPFRKFRHVFFHGYGWDIDWVRIREGINQIPEVYDLFVKAVRNYLGAPVS